jgi:hypothetical protein
MQLYGRPRPNRRLFLGEAPSQGQDRRPGPHGKAGPGAGPQAPKGLQAGGGPQRMHLDLDLDLDLD